jgi:hypothetical protein
MRLPKQYDNPNVDPQHSAMMAGMRLPGICRKIRIAPYLQVKKAGLVAALLEIKWRNGNVDPV